jgi:hypothetical protein
MINSIFRRARWYRTGDLLGELAGLGLNETGRAGPDKMSGLPGTGAIACVRTDVSSRAGELL